ncbi:hypothetical protein CDV54_06370 [Paracoccus yeei]|nr:hypothetical protein CDV54_06370 [Paracoccus yeei]
MRQVGGRAARRSHVRRLAGVHPNQIKQWRDQLLEGATGVFGEASKADPEPSIDMKNLHAKINAKHRLPDKVVQSRRLT